LGHKGKNANAKLEKLFYTSQKHWSMCKLHAMRNMNSLHFFEKKRIIK
jgi:hypothetical protein